MANFPNVTEIIGQIINDHPLTILIICCYSFVATCMVGYEFVNAFPKIYKLVQQKHVKRDPTFMRWIGVIALFLFWPLLKLGQCTTHLCNGSINSVYNLGVDYYAIEEEKEKEKSSTADDSTVNDPAIESDDAMHANFHEELTDYSNVYNPTVYRLTS